MNLELYDTTLRDGAQQSGISLSLKDKLNITLKLDDLGIQTVEGGYAGSNPKDDEYFKLIRKENLKNVVESAFGSTMKPNSSINQDPIVKAMLNAETKTLAVVGKSSAKQVEKVLENVINTKKHTSSSGKKASVLDNKLKTERGALWGSEWDRYTPGG